MKNLQVCISYSVLVTNYTPCKLRNMSEKPKKYVFVDGVMKLNPAYTAYQNAANPSAPATNEPNTALAVVSSMDDIMNATELQANSTGAPMQMSPSVCDIFVNKHICFSFSQP